MKFPLSISTCFDVYNICVLIYLQLIHASVATVGFHLVASMTKGPR